jgi:protein-disulfide isomerase
MASAAFLVLLVSLPVSLAQDEPRFYDKGLDGVDLSGLTDEQTQLALKVLNDTDCTCGCGMRVAQCRVEDQNCPRSPILARAIVDAVRRGQNEADVRAAYSATVGATGKSGRSTSRPPAEEIVLIPVEDSPVRGSEAASVTVVEFSDFQCPYCSRAEPIITKLLAEFEGQVRLIFKHFPLPFHPQARIAAAAAEAAREQGKFWEMHDLLFQNTEALERDDLRGYAQQLGLDLPRFETALDNSEIDARVERDITEARRVGVNGTPTFYVDGRRLGNHQEKAFRRAIQRALQAQAASAGGQ